MKEIKFLQTTTQSRLLVCLRDLGFQDMAQRIAQQCPPPAGKVGLFMENWKTLTKDQWVLECVQGYAIDWIAKPFQKNAPHELVFPAEQENCLSDEVQKLLLKNAISEVPSKQGTKFISQLFAVPKKDGTLRPIINLKSLNHFVQTVSFKMEGIHTLKDILQQGDWMTKVDLKDAYFAIPIAEKDRPFLSFRWGGKTYQFNCLPFGLSSAPWVFTKTTKCIMIFLRTLGLRIIIYIDDILILAESEETAREHTACLIFLLENLGFTVNREKSQVEPAQETEFLGLVVNSMEMELKLPSKKIKKIKSEARALLNQKEGVSSLMVSRFLGKLNHAAQAVATAPLFYRQLQDCLQRALEAGDQDYSYECPLSEEAKDELIWWTDNLSSRNGKCLLLKKADIVIETDASTTGWGAQCNGVRTGGPWTPLERQMHINCLELLAASLAVRSFAKETSDVTIHLKMDNTTALTYINKLGGTVSPELNRQTKLLWEWCFQKNITLKASHLAGSLNVIADEESRVMRDRSDWKLCPTVFQKIQRILGPLDVDLFASRLTHQLPQYASWRPDPTAIATDAFTLDWTAFRAFANPPWNLVGRVLQQVRQQRAHLVLIAPVWPGQVWYPMLLEMLIQEPMLITSTTNPIQPTHPVNHPEISPQLAVWTMSGQNTPPRNFLEKLQNSSLPHGVRNRPRRTIPCSTNGLAGATKGVLIPFREI